MLTLPGYQIKEKLYESDNSQVYRARREADGCPVVLKALKGTHPSPEQIAWFEREYEVTRNINLPGVIEVYGLETEQNRRVMVLEDFGGDSLALLGIAGQLTVADFLKLAIELTAILGQIHRQHIIHKDINPSNIILNPATGQVKLIDFGVSTVLSQENPTFRSPNMLEGTLAYVSPEQTGRMNRAIDYRADFYSLGVTFYELLTGQLPHTAQDPLELVHAHIAKSPTSPHVVKADIPQVVSDVVMKLMAKNAEDRYQTPHGLATDLEFCRANLTDLKALPAFELGQSDFAGRLQVPQKLYGREREIARLDDAFDRVSIGQAELILVTGHAGVGKSSLVHETHKSIIERRGHLFEGKCDQFQRDIPYHAWIQVFSALVNQLLTESHEDLATWRSRIGQALGDTGQVLTDVIPNLNLLTGLLPDVPELGATEAQNRFNYVLRNFVSVVARPEHPLVIFIDDLQWADAASLNLLKVLMTDVNSRHLLVIGAYRDDEVGEAHPLLAGLEEMERQQVVVQTVTLHNLALDDVNQLVSEAIKEADTVRWTHICDLASLVYEKTRGNPFFVHQFLKSLYREGLLHFDLDSSEWQWDPSTIRQRDMTDNVVKLMAGQAQELPVETQSALKLAACIGNRFDLKALAAIQANSHREETAHREIAARLRPALMEGLIFVNVDPTGFQNPSDLGLVEYRFAHDHIRQAVYSLIAERDKKQTHLQIGQLLLAHAPLAARQEQIFDIVNQLNQGRELIAERTERETLAELNLVAGKRAKAAAAYEAAFNYLQVGVTLLEPDSWQRHYDLWLALHAEAAEAAYLSAEFEQMESLIAAALSHAETLLDKVKVYQVRIQAYQAQNEPLKAVETALALLKLLGIHLPQKPGRLRVLRGLLGTKLRLGRKRIKDLVDLPEMTEPHKLAAMQVLSSVGPAAFRTIPELFALSAFEMVNLSVKYGNAPTSVTGYANYALILGGMGDINGGYQFGQLAWNLLERHEAIELEAKTAAVVHGYIKHWKEHFRETIAPLREAYGRGLETGDFEYAAYAAYMCAGKSYFVGQELTELEKEMASYSQVIGQFEQKIPFYMTELHRQVVLNLMGRAQDPRRLAGQAYDEEKMLPLHLQADDKTALFSLHLHKLILDYLFQAYPQAVKNAAKAAPYLGAATVSASFFVFHFYDALAQLAMFPGAPRSEQRRILKRVNANQKKMRKWARHAPMNHRHKWHLVEAERARVLGNGKEAREHYDRAIALAQENNYLNEQALAYELAGRFYLGREQAHLARHYLREAHYAYVQWGAEAKAQDLEARYPQVLALEALVVPGGTSTTPTPERQAGSVLDLASMLKASQALSSEIVLDKLLATLLQIVLENAGATRGCLVLERDGQFTIEAAGSIEATEVTIRQAQLINGSDDLPAAMVRYVARSRESVLVNDAANEGLFTRDPYVIARQPKSVLCMPLIYQGKVSGVLYLENNLSTGAFTPDRLQVLQLLSTQAAISLENARLYDTLEQKVAERTRALHQSNEQLQQEVVERRRTEAALRESEERLGSFMDSATDAFTIWNREFNLVELNKAALGYLPPGTKRRDVIGKNLLDLLPGARERGNYERYLEVVKTGEPLSIEEMVLDPEFGETSLSVRAFKVGDGLGIITTDVTERKHAEQERERLITELDAYAHTVAHNLKNPLGLVVGYAEALIAFHDEVSAEGLERQLTSIASSGRKMGSIIDELLLLASVRRLTDIETAPLDMAAIVDDTLTRLEKVIDESGGVIVKPDRWPDALGYAPWIEEIWANYISNALKYGGAPPRVELGADLQPEDMVRFWVRDNGQGLTKEGQGQLFAQFSRLDRARAHGHGLGLSIVKRIVEKLGGQVGVESESGQGCTFYFTLPRT